MKNESNLRDLELIKLIKKGDVKALEEIIEKYESRAFCLVKKFITSQEDAEEVVQDVFLTLFKKAKGFQGKSAFSSWLYRVIINATFMKLRKNKKEQVMFFDDLMPGMSKIWAECDLSYSSGSDFKILTSELSSMLNEAIYNLPNRYRSVFILRDVNGLSNEEVSAILTLSLPAVKSRLHRARLMLQKKLSDCHSQVVGRAYGSELSL